MSGHHRMINGAQYPLRIPSGARSGLKITRGFTVIDDNATELTIDFDLRRSVYKPRGQADYLLRPALRMVNNRISGEISGEVSDTRLTAHDCFGRDGRVNAAVYVFNGRRTIPDDIDGEDAEAVTSTLVKPNSNSAYTYTAAFLEPGEYTVALTCQSHLDEPDEDDAITFPARTSVVLGNGETQRVDF